MPFHHLTPSVPARLDVSVLERFAQVADPRKPRGVRHSVASILALCQGAVLAGACEVDEVTA